MRIKHGVTPEHSSETVFTSLDHGAAFVQGYRQALTDLAAVLTPEMAELMLSLKELLYDVELAEQAAAEE